MSKLVTTFEKINPTTKAAVIFLISIILLYSPVIFLNQTLVGTGSYNYSIDPLYSNSKQNVIPTTVDPAADFLQNFPVMKLATNMILHGDLPLWNPYLGAGTPLAADTVNYLLSPAMVGFLLPSGLWDVSLLLLLWIAGCFTFLYLQTLRLNFTSSILGGIFFMFSGALTWYLPHTSTAVFIFTPFILYSIEKIISTKSPKFIFLGSLAFASGILGAHIESILLQLILVGSYVFYRIFTIENPTNFHYLHSKLNNNIKQIQKRRLIILSFIIMSFIGGLGISSFFTIPVYEYLHNTLLAHDTSIGTAFSPPLLLTTIFIPYVMGSMQGYWDPTFSGNWNVALGYVGMIVLFFSIFSSLMFLKSKETGKSIPLFFLGVGIFFMLKVIGIPGINNLGTLPILEHVVFPRYTSGIIPFCFVISAAFGVNYLSNPKINKHFLKLSLIISIVVIGILSVPYISPFLSSIRNNQIYFLVQISQSIFFLISVYFISEKIIRKKTNFLPLIYITLLELFLYIPVGLSQIFMFYKFAVIFLGIVLIIFFSIFNNNLKFFSHSQLKIYLITSIFILTIVGGIFVSLYSPYGMLDRKDPFLPVPVTNFIKQNLGDKRIFSFDYTLGPNHSAGYEIPSIAIMSAFNIDSFTKFNHNFLDHDAWLNTLGYNPWSYTYKQPQIIDKLSESKKYFDFLGVKYFTTSVNLNGFMPASGGAETASPIGSAERSIVQEFKSHFTRIDSIDIQLGTYGHENHGNVILTLDSVPYNKIYHRESIVRADDLIDNSFQNFQFNTLNGVKDKMFELKLHFLPYDTQSGIAAWYYNGVDSSTMSLETVKDLTGGQLKLNNSLSNGILVFSVNSNTHTSVFKFKDFNIYENLDAFPRSFLVHKFILVDHNTAQNFLIKNPDFDLRNNVVLEQQLPSEEDNLLKSSISVQNSNAKIVSYSANNVIIHTNSTSPSLLVLTDTYYPGWQASVDGKESTIYRADGLVRSIFIPQGSHVVKFLYIPQSFIMGLSISLLTMIALFGIVVFPNLFKRLRVKVKNTRESL